MATKIPKLTFNEGSPEVGFGQITDVIIGQLGYPLTEISKAELESRIDNASIADNALRKITVVADKPAPESNEIEISHFRKIRSPKSHTINLRIDETNTDNYNFLRGLEEEGINKVSIWFITNSGYIYGGLEGIEASINLDLVIPESGDELETIQGVLTWKGNHPQRDINPLAQDVNYNDTIAPTVSTIPANGDTNIPGDTSIVVEFSEPVRIAGGTELTDANANTVITLVDSLSNPVDFSASVLYTKKQVVLVPVLPLAADTYTVSVSGVEDYNTNALVAYSASFTVV